MPALRNSLKPPARVIRRGTRILKPGTTPLIVLDGSTPANVQLANSVSTTATTASFSPPAGSLVAIAVVICFDANTPTGPTVTCADSLGNSFTAGPSAYDGAAEGTYQFTRYYAAAPGSITVTATRSVSTGAALFFVKTWVLTGAKASQAGAASASAHNTSGTSFAGAITPTATGSWVLASAAIGSNQLPVASGLTTDTSWQSGGDGTTAVAGHVVTGTPAAETIGWTGTSAFWSWAALEILPVPAPAWAVLQSASASTAATTVSATFSTANVQAGTKIIAIVSVGATSAPAVTSVKDAALNTWTQVGNANQANGRVYIFALDTPAGDVGTKPTLTATAAGTAGLGIVIQEVSGLASGNTTAMCDGTAGTLTGTASSTGSPSYSSAAAGEYLLSAYGDFGTGNTVVPAGGWTPDAHNVNASTNSCCLAQYKSSTGGAETDGFTSADGGGWAVAEIAFKLAGAGGAQAAPAAPGHPVRARQLPARGGTVTRRAGTFTAGVTLATSTSVKSLQRAAADKIAWLYDGSAVIGYWNGTAGQIAQVTAPLTAPSVTNLITTAEDAISIWADNTAGTSSDIWVASAFDDGSGSGPGLHVRHGSYSGTFTWDTATAISGVTSAATVQCTITWTGTYLIVFWWDGTSGTDRISYAWTTDKTGTSGWSATATFSESATWSTIVQVSARHSAKLAATVVAYEANSGMHWASLPDSSTPAIANWSGRTVLEQFTDSGNLFGGPQVVIDEASGDIHVAYPSSNNSGPTWFGVTYWHGTYSGGTVSWGSRVIVDSAGSTTGPADIAAAADVNGTVYVLWVSSTSQGSLRYATLTAPYTSASAATTLISGGASSNPRWPHVPAVSASQHGLHDALPVLYTDTTGSPYPIRLLTSVTLPAAPAAPPPVRLGHPVQARRLPAQGGRTASRRGAYAQAGPPVRPHSGPVRAVRPQPPRGGTAAGRDGTYGGIGPALRALAQAVAGKLRGLPPRGRAAGHAGTYQGPGAPVGPARGPVRAARQPAQPGGHTASRAGTFTAAAPQAGPPVYPLHGPVRAPRAAVRGGSTSSRAGTYGRTGPPVRPATGPVRAQPAPQPGGHTASRAGTLTAGAPQAGPPVYPLGHPVQARRLPARAGSTSSHRGAYGGTGPPVKAAQGPVRAQPAPQRGGRAASRSGTFTFVSLTSGPPVYPLHGPVEARRLPQRGGSTSSRRGVQGITGPPVKPATGPVKAQPGPQRGGHTASRAGTFTAAALTSGPPVYPLAHPVQARRQPAQGGRVIRRAGTFQGTGPPVKPATGPVGVSRRQPPPPARGRTASQRGPYAQTGPPVKPLGHALRGQPAKPVLTGRAAWRSGTYTAPFVPPFTVGALTAADAAGSVLTAAGSSSALTASTTASGTLTATDQRTGGPGG
jgi:hypothetical protein